ncbi:hypothetical protein ABIA35_008390 [Catenulispora sp. MAP12-49]
MSTVDGVSADTRLIGIVIGLAVAAVLAVARAVRRKRTIDHGEEARATVLHAEHVVPRGRSLTQPYFRIRVAIPRGDGTEIVAVARAAHWAINKMPKPGWTVPVLYRERLLGRTAVEIMGPPSRATKGAPPAEPPV